MRKTYMEDEIEVSFGLDHASGFFLQVFKEDQLVIDLDQSLLYGFGFQPIVLSYEKARQVIQEHCPNAMRKFESFVKEVGNYLLDPTMKGYIVDEKGNYDDYTILRKNEEFQNFLNGLNEGKHILLTDIFDRYVYSNSPAYQK